MNAIASFVVIAGLLLSQDYFMPSSVRMSAGAWMGSDVDAFYVSYRARFRKRLLLLLVGSAAVALSVGLHAPGWAQVSLLLFAFISHGALTLFDIVKSRRF